MPRHSGATLVLALIAAFVASVPVARAETITLTFEHYGTWQPPDGDCPPGGCYSSIPWTVQTVDGITVWAPEGVDEQYSPWGSFNNFYPSNGTGVLYDNRGGEIFFSADPSAPFTQFSLLSVDLAAPPWYGLGASAVLISGYREQDLVWHQVVDVNEVAYTTASGSFVPVDRIVLTGLSPYPGHKFVLDNFRVHAVPEPDTVLLLGAGIAGLALVRGRRRRTR